MKYAAAALALAGTAAFLSVVPANAKDKPQAAAAPPLYQAVIDCRAIADDAERLACFDRTVVQMAAATTKRDLVILDRESMRETRKGLFGFSLPKLKLFGGGDYIDEREEVKEIESTITGIRGDPNGHTIYVIEGGARWQQAEARDVYPEVGNPIRIRRAAFGSYFANIRKQTAVRVTRLAN